MDKPPLRIEINSAKPFSGRTNYHWTVLLLSLIVVSTGVLSSPGCIPRNDSEVVVYAALDREFSKPILDNFTEQTGVQVLAKYDVESDKTVGLVNAIIAESNRPRCDVFWNNEILHTLRLQKRGLLDVYHSPNATSIPAPFRDSDGHWTGFAARARVLIINTELIADDTLRPTSIFDLADEAWKNQCAMAKPLAGTTYTHAVCLFEMLGDEPAKVLLGKIKENARIVASNKQVAKAVARGQVAFGITDTDDAMIEIEAGNPVTIAYPDQQEGGMGTLFLPNTISIIKKGPNTPSAMKLIDFLLTPEVETRLAGGPSAQIPLNPQLSGSSRISTPSTIRSSEVSFTRVADTVEAIHPWLVEQFSTAD